MTTKKKHRQISATVQVRRLRRPQANEKTNFFFTSKKQSLREMVPSSQSGIEDFLEGCARGPGNVGSCQPVVMAVRTLRHLRMEERLYGECAEHDRVSDVLNAPPDTECTILLRDRCTDNDSLLRRPAACGTSPLLVLVALLFALGMLPFVCCPRPKVAPFRLRVKRRVLTRPCDVVRLQLPSTESTAPGD